MSLEELSQQRIVSYERFVEFVEREWNYPVNEEVAKEVYKEYVDKRKRSESSLSIFDHHKNVLFHYNVRYGMKLILSMVEKLREEKIKKKKSM